MFIENMEIKEITNKEIWESFLFKCEEKTFLDSWSWAEFQKKEGNKVWLLGVYANQELAGVALAVLIKARRGSFLFIPHGPVGKKEILKPLLEKAKEIGTEEKASFIRISPVWERSEENIEIFKKFGFKDSAIHMHPELTWELDIRAGEEDLLKSMRKTTRYLIKQAEKNNDIEIVKSSDLKDLEEFYRLYQKTVKRHHFIPFSLDYLRNQFSCFSPDKILIFLGRHKGEIISSAIIVFWQNIAFYHHGASLSSKVPVSYLLQWKIIKEAKARNCYKYNFWGIAPIIENCKLKIVNCKKHPWQGLTLFKTGFGGYKKEYVKTQDLALSNKYYLTYIIETIRRIKRGL